MTDKERAIKEVSKLSEEQVAKVLIFMAGLEAGRNIETTEPPMPPTP